MPVTPFASSVSTPRSAISKASVDRDTHPSSDRLTADSRLRRPFQTKTNIPSSGAAPRLSTVSIKSVRRERRPRASSVVRNGVLATEMLQIARANVQSSQTRRSSERSETLKSMSVNGERNANLARWTRSVEPEMNGTDAIRRQQSSSLLLSSPIERKIAKPVLHLDGFAEEFENDQLAEHLFKSQPANKPIRSSGSNPSVIDDQALILDLPSTPSSQASPPEDPLSDPEVIQKIAESSRKRRPSSGRVKTPISKRVRRGGESTVASKEVEAVSNDHLQKEASEEPSSFKTDDTRLLKVQGPDNGSEEGDIIIIPRRRPKPRTVPTRASARLASGHQVIVGETEIVEDSDRTPTRPKHRARVKATNQAPSSRLLSRSSLDPEARTTGEKAQSVQSLDSDDLYS
ncbi:hypothetical protein [Phaffia rhodozyma]|uniref:Uncharacterized protein n=1 Tax=Phaffia rhodozyma TaxID=264483 RepID=A0A0F7ST85_PHARH|nr:hypothetical protein [Phaffia rhodozyma]